jgi:hypothetical protein
VRDRGAIPDFLTRRQCGVVMFVCDVSHLLALRQHGKQVAHSIARRGRGSLPRAC